MNVERTRFIQKVIGATSKLEGWCSYEKAQRLALLVLDSDAQLTVEIGIYGGKSLIPMALACKQKGAGTVVGIDPWAPAPALEGENTEVNDKWWEGLDFKRIKEGFISGMVKNGVQDIVKVYEERSTDAVKHFDDASIDVFHSDGNHSEKVTCDEVEMWMPKMKMDSYWICDDTNWPSVHKSLALLESYGYQLEGDFQTWRIYRRVNRKS